MEFSYPLFVCDVGGTNVRIAVVDAPGDTPNDAITLPTAAHPGLLATIKLVQERRNVRARSVVVSAAGPIEGRRVHLTNASWEIDGPEIARALGLDQGLLLNDFEAQAIALPHVPASWTRAIGATAAGDPQAPRLVLGPGTGLGAAALLRAQDKWLPATTEAGHMSLGPADDFDAAIWPHLERVEGRVTLESVISGPGLRRVYLALCAARGAKPACADNAALGAAARAGDAIATETIRAFWRYVARAAGDLALAFLPRGGVTLAGGVLPRLADWLDDDAFRRAFADKAPMAEIMREMPVALVTDPDSALLGMASLAAAPRTYAVDYARRSWR